MSLKAPNPQTVRAYLVSEGYPAPTFTHHRYVGANVVTLKGGDGEAWEYIFECEQTGARRRWGTAYITEPLEN